MNTVVDQPTRREVALAADWHGGQASMLYAVASTGVLSLGTRRPVDCATDAEWADHLRNRLCAELREVRALAVQGGDGMVAGVAGLWLRRLDPATL